MLSLPTLGDSVTVWCTVAAVVPLTDLVNAMAARSKARDDSLGLVINKKRKRIQAQDDEIARLRNMMAANSGSQHGQRGGRKAGASAGGGSAGRLTPQDKRDLFKELKREIAQEYLPRALFPGVTSPVTLASYATHPELNAKDYVDGRRLEGKAYVNHTQLTQAIPTPVMLPPRVGERLELLERGLFQPGGAVDKLGNSL